MSQVPELLGGSVPDGEAAVPPALPNQHVGFVRRRRQPELLGGCVPDGEAAVPPALPNQHGQAVPLSAALLVVMTVVALALAKLGVGVIDHARAQAAADVVALASAVQPDAAFHRTAELVAEHNAATVVSIERIGSDVLVTVQRGKVAATARARAVAESDVPFP